MVRYRWAGRWNFQWAEQIAHKIKCEGRGARGNARRMITQLARCSSGFFPFDGEDISESRCPAHSSQSQQLVKNTRFDVYCELNLLYLIFIKILCCVACCLHVVFRFSFPLFAIPPLACFSFWVGVSRIFTFGHFRPSFRRTFDRCIESSKWN